MGRTGMKEKKKSLKTDVNFKLHLHCTQIILAKREPYSSRAPGVHGATPEPVLREIPYVQTNRACIPQDGHTQNIFPQRSQAWPYPHTHLRVTCLQQSHYTKQLSRHRQWHLLPRNRDILQQTLMRQLWGSCVRQQMKISNLVRKKIT